MFDAKRNALKQFQGKEASRYGSLDEGNSEILNREAGPNREYTDMANTQNTVANDIDSKEENQKQKKQLKGQGWAN